MNACIPVSHHKRIKGGRPFRLPDMHVLDLKQFIALAGTVLLPHTAALADEQYSSECARKIADIVRIFESEFDRGPRTNEQPYFFGLLTYTYETYQVLEENKRKVKKSVPIFNCSEADLYEVVASTKLKPNPFFQNGTSIVVSFETKHKSAQFSFDTINKTISRANLRIKKHLMEE